MQRRNFLTGLGLAGLWFATAPKTIAAAKAATRETAMDKTALVIIDLQNDYFPGGAFPLDAAEAAGAKSARLLARFRELSLPVVHVRHESVRPGATFFLPGTPGADIHASVAPRPGEAVVLKHYPNSFRKTGLEAILRDQGITRLLVSGMMTNMCVDATVRAAFDLGFAATVAHDACAAKALSFNGVEASAPQVHAAFLAALAMVYAKVTSTDECLAGLTG